jgi:hypothetical protein
MGAVVEAMTKFEIQTLGKPRVTDRVKTTPDVMTTGDVALSSAVGTTCVAQTTKD